MNYLKELFCRIRNGGHWFVCRDLMGLNMCGFCHKVECQEFFK